MYVVPTGPERLFAGDDVDLLLPGAADGVCTGAEAFMMLPQPTMPSIAATAAIVTIFIDLLPGAGPRAE